MKYIYVILVLWIGPLCWAQSAPPPLPVPGAVGKPRPRTPADGLGPPAFPRLAKWEDGMIYNLTEDQFKIHVASKWYDLYHCSDLAKGDWKRIARFDSETALNDKLDYFHNHPSGFYRVSERKKPHPPPPRMAGINIQRGSPTKKSGFRKK